MGYGKLLFKSVITFMFMNQSVRLYDVRLNLLRASYQHSAGVLDCCFFDKNLVYSGGMDCCVKS